MAPLPEVNTVTTTTRKVTHAKRRRRFPSINMPFLVVIICIVAYGLTVVFSAVQDSTTYSFSRQAITVLIGAILMFLLWRFDYRRLSEYTTVFLIINIVLILSPHIPGLGTDAGTGTQSWLNLGIQIQPGEFAKVTVILLDASVMARYSGKLDDVREYLKALVIMLIPFVCIMTQPDLGTGLVYLFITAVALVIGGVRAKYLLITLASCVAAVVAMLLVDELIKNSTGEYMILKEYQRSRLLVFIDSSYDPTGDGYNLRQAQIAIGSGGLFGKGLFQGTQHTLGILPESETDFIFCVLAEELGFFGVLVLLALYAALLLICFNIARRCDDLFGMVVAMCAMGMWLFQILENIGMDCGLMPITGIPLPFMSYGSSFMIVNFLLLGLVGSVWAHSGSRQ